MKSGLTGLEIRAFGKLEGNALSISELAGRLKISAGLASTTAASLVLKGLVLAEDRGKRRLLSRALASSALKLSELLAANPHIGFDSVLANSTLRVLAGFTTGPSTIRSAAKSSLAPEITVRRVISRLMERAIMHKSNGDSYEIRLPLLKEFVEAWLLQQLEVLRKDVPGSLVVRGPHALLRSSKKGVPSRMAPTGMSVFNKYRVGLAFDFDDYYFHAFSDSPVKLGLEEHLVHSLLRSTIISSGREVSYALLVMYKNKLREERFREYAAILGARSAAGQCLEFLKKFGEGGMQQHDGAFLQKEGPTFPSREEFQELVKQYE